MDLTAIQTVDQLEDVLSEPRDYVMEALGSIDGDFMILGAGGKMGPTLCRMLRRAIEQRGDRRSVIAVSRFSDPAAAKSLQAHGIQTISCDLFDETAVNALPDAANVIYMAGRKFGSTGQESLTWAANAWLPAIVCKRFATSRIAAFSTGNVYGLVDIGSGGSLEGDTLNPQGEYAMSCLARERIFEYFSRTNATPVSILRLNYACEFRYGVLVDIAQQIVAGNEVDISMGHVNVIWQQDANAIGIASLAHAATPPFALNIAGPEFVCVHDLAERLASAMNLPLRVTGIPADTALLNNGGQSHTLLGPPVVSLDALIEGVAHWVKRGGASLDKPTHFEVRDGRF